MEISKKYLQKASLAVIFSLGLLGGGFLGFAVAKAGVKKVFPVDPQVIRDANKDYKYIAPLLAVDVSDQKDFKELQPFKTKVNQLITSLQQQGKVNNVGFYFRDYNTGHWTGIGEDSQFIPGSLMKVPLMIAYFRAAEGQPEILNFKILYDGKSDDNAKEYIKPSQSLVAGQSYTVEELVRRMIVYSDNNATILLIQHLDVNAFYQIYSDLNIALPTSLDNFTDFMSAKQYSIFFRVLHNATYINRSDSEKALDLLTQTDFKSGLVAGIPGDVNISHKFGEYFEIKDGNPQHELHDCGIIYAPSHPYLLCLMTRGTNEPDLENAIQQISGLVYTEVVNNYQ